MYQLFKTNKSISPKEFYNMETGEQMLLNAFVNIEHDERISLMKDVEAMPVVNI